MVDDNLKQRNAVDGTTWEFLKGGWWVLHIIAIAAVYWLGHILTS